MLQSLGFLYLSPCDRAPSGLGPKHARVIAAVSPCKSRSPSRPPDGGSSDRPWRGSSSPTPTPQPPTCMPSPEKCLSDSRPRASNPAFQPCGTHIRSPLSADFFSGLLRRRPAPSALVLSVRRSRDPRPMGSPTSLEPLGGHGRGRNRRHQRFLLFLIRIKCYVSRLICTCIWHHFGGSSTLS
jgi:hypothetical protein